MFAFALSDWDDDYTGYAGAVAAATPL